MGDSFDDEEPTTLDTSFLQPLTLFYHNSVALVKRCKKPDSKEFLNVLRATGVGFLCMGFLGFAIKLVHIPINNILVGA